MYKRINLIKFSLNSYLFLFLFQILLHFQFKERIIHHTPLQKNQRTIPTIHKIFFQNHHDQITHKFKEVHQTICDLQSLSTSISTVPRSAHGSTTMISSIRVASEHQHRCRSNRASFISCKFTKTAETDEFFGLISARDHEKDTTRAKGSGGWWSSIVNRIPVDRRPWWIVRVATVSPRVKKI